MTTMVLLAGPVSRLAAEPITSTSTGEAVQFWVLGTLAVIGAIGVVAATKAVYSAIFLALTMIILAVFYLAQAALFLGVVQIVVYTGAVMMLFLFVVMLVGVDSADSLVETLRGQRIVAAVAGVGFGVLLIAGLGNATVQAGRSDFAGIATGPTGNVDGLAELIFIRYVWAFELTGALLIVATIGAMVLAHRERVGERKTQRELSEERFRRWGSGEGDERVTPLPNPGVYARHNAVDIPALLPDGSTSELSVNHMLRSRLLDRSLDVAEATYRPPDPEPMAGTAGAEPLAGTAEPMAGTAGAASIEGEEHTR